MSGFTINNNRIVSYEGNEKSIIIPVGITRIGTGAFKGKNVEQIIFEDEASLKSIDDEAFADCKELKSMLIPNGVVQIGDRAFSGCTALQYVRIPSSVLLVGEDVLFGHSSDLVIIGEKGTEAETIASKYRITLQSDEQCAVKAVQATEKGKSSVETRSFEILGETITCSNTLRNQKYDKYLEKYPLKREEEKTRAELKTVQNKISKTQTKTSEQEIVSVLKRVFGVILIIGGFICGVAAQNAVLGLVVAVPGFLVFLSVFMPSKELRTLRKEEKVLTAKISEIEKLPPFIEDDKKQKDAEVKAEAERLEGEVQVKKAAKKRKLLIAIAAPIALGLLICIICLTQPPVPSSTSKNVRIIHNIYMKEKLDDYSKKTLYNFGLNVPNSSSYDDKQWNGTWVVTEDFVKEYIETYSAEEFIDVYQKYIVSYITDTHRSSADLEFYNSNPQLLDYISSTTRLLFEMPELFEVVNYNPATDEVLKETSKTETVSGRFNVGSDNHIEWRESELTIDTYYYSDYYVEHRHGFEYDEGEYGWSNGKFYDVPASFVPVDEYRLCLDESSGFVSSGKSLKDLNLKWVSIGSEKYYERVIYEIRVGKNTYRYPKSVYILTTNKYDSDDYYIFYGS